MSKHSLSRETGFTRSGWMVCALGKPMAHRVAPDAVWIPFGSTTAHATVCGHVAVPAPDDVVDSYPKCDDCAAPRPARTTASAA